MNQQSTDSSVSSQGGASAEAISRRAYEIWESEGRPEGCDLRHWLQAEEELGASRSSNNGRHPETAGRTEDAGNRPTGTDRRQTQNPRAASSPSTSSVPSGNRDQKRSATPFSGEKYGSAAVSGQNPAKRKPAAAPML